MKIAILDCLENNEKEYSLFFFSFSKIFGPGLVERPGSFSTVL